MLLKAPSGVRRKACPDRGSHETALVAALAFVRKVMVVAHERGVAGRLNCVRTIAATSKPHAELMIDNPLSKIPSLVLDDGTVIYDSPVICEYFDSIGDEETPKLFPSAPKARLTALRRQALGDGFLDLLVLLRDERLRGIRGSASGQRCPAQKGDPG